MRIAAVVESLLEVCLNDSGAYLHRCTDLNPQFSKANPRLATKRDDDGRLPIHWAVSYNHFPIVELLVSRKDFDPDVEVGCFPPFSRRKHQIKDMIFPLRKLMGLHPAGSL